MAYNGWGLQRAKQLQDIQEMKYEEAADEYYKLIQNGKSDKEARDAIEEKYDFLQDDIRKIDDVMEAYHDKYGGTSKEELEEQAKESKEESKADNLSTEESNKKLLNDLNVNSEVVAKAEENGALDELKEAAATSETSKYADPQDMAEYLDYLNRSNYEEQMDAALEGLQEAYDDGNDSKTLLGDYKQDMDDVLAGMDSNENAAFQNGDFQSSLGSKVAEEVARTVGNKPLNTAYNATRGTTASNYYNSMNQAMNAANVKQSGYQNVADISQNKTDTAKQIADDLTAYKADAAGSEYNAANSLRRSAINGYEEDDPLKTASDVIGAVKSGTDAGTTFASMFLKD